VIGAAVGAVLGSLAFSGEEDFSGGARFAFTAIGTGAGAGLGWAFSRRVVRQVVFQKAPDTQFEQALVDTCVRAFLRSRFKGAHHAR
jgi:hypothetical protein